MKDHFPHAVGRTDGVSAGGFCPDPVEHLKNGRSVPRTTLERQSQLLVDSAKLRRHCPLPLLSA